MFVTSGDLRLCGVPEPLIAGKRLVARPEVLNWVLAKQDKAAQRETDREAWKAAYCRYRDAVLEISKNFALCAASYTAREVRDEVGFFQTVRAGMVKASETSGRSAAGRALAIRQIVNGRTKTA